MSSRAVDERGQIRGQLVDRPWTTPARVGRPREHRVVHDPVPSATHTPPRRELPRSARSTAIHSPYYYCWISLPLENSRRTTSWMEDAGPSRTPRPGPGPEMTPVAERLYGGRTGPDRAGRRAPTGRPVRPDHRARARPSPKTFEPGRCEHSPAGRSTHEVPGRTRRPRRRGGLGRPQPAGPAPGPGAGRGAARATSARRGPLTVSGLRLRGLGPGRGRRRRSATPGRVLVSGRLLADITRALPAKPVDVAVDGTAGVDHLRQRPVQPADHAGRGLPELPAMPQTAGVVAADVSPRPSPRSRSPPAATTRCRCSPASGSRSTATLTLPPPTASGSRSAS